MNETTQDIEQEVHGFFTNYYGFAPLTGDENIVESTGLDSVQFMELIYFLETRYKVKIPPKMTTVEKFGTVEKIAVVIENLAGAA